MVLLWLMLWALVVGGLLFLFSRMVRPEPKPFISTLFGFEMPMKYWQIDKRDAYSVFAEQMDVTRQVAKSRTLAAGYGFGDVDETGRPVKWR